MDFFIQFRNLITFFLDFLCLINVIIFFIFLIIVLHVLLFLIRDKKYIKAFKKYKDPDKISIDDLKEIRLVNIIIPAWNEDELFRQCLESITKLNYPKLSVIISAGGSEETIEIANSFRNFGYFTICFNENMDRC